MAEIHIDPIPINPARDRWGNRRNQEIQTIVAGVNGLSEEVDLLAEGVIPDLTDAGMAAVAESGGEFTAALTAQSGPVRSMADGSVLPGYRYRVIVDPLNPTEIEDIIVEAI